MTIRLANVEDAAALDHFFQQLDRETCFMLYEAGEQGIEPLYSNPKEQRR
ncbi:acetyltransferase [Aeromonas salmonicida subsp. pectinolytica 34mel]|nr:acetyltransferase [Aeromonas salmonicida subsp. pectinolytica 34mel]